MADNTKLLLFGGAAVAAWWFFIRKPDAPAAPPPAAPNPNAITGANTLDGVYARLVTSGGTSTRSVDEWDVVLTSVMPAGFVAPDPMPLFQAAVPGFDRSQKISAGQYWAVLAPWLKTNAGLSGLGPRGLGWMAQGWVN